MQCPCCNHEVGKELLWSPEIGALMNLAGCGTTFNKKQSLIFDALWEAAKLGKGVHIQKFIHMLYRDDAEGGALTAKNVAFIYISKVRTRIVWLGLDIKTKSSVYYLTFGSPTFGFDHWNYREKNHNWRRANQRVAA